jgi:hypothetical protein
VSQKHERQRHEALARATGSWQSWSVDRWWTNGMMAVELDAPFAGPHMRLVFECMCDLTQRRTHEHDLTRFCVFVDQYERDAEIRTRLGTILTKAQQVAARGAVPLVIGDEPWESELHPGRLIVEARIRGEDHPHAWVALNHAYVEAVRKHAPIVREWLLVGMPRGVPVGTAFSTRESPMVIGVHGSRLVAVVMPMATNDSAIGMEAAPPDEVEVTP